MKVSPLSGDRNGKKYGASPALGQIFRLLMAQVKSLSNENNHYNIYNLQVSRVNNNEMIEDVAPKQASKGGRHELFTESHRRTRLFDSTVSDSRLS